MFGRSKITDHCTPKPQKAMEKEPDKTLPQSAGLQDLLKKSRDYAHRYDQLVQDVKNLSPGALKTAYPGEYSSWANRKYWAKANRVQWSASMTAFPDFLMVTGPIPEKSWTLDRINPEGHYVPENIRWASKKTQSQNRTNAVPASFNGTEYTVSELAELAEVSPDAVRMGVRRYGYEYIARLMHRHATAAAHSEESHWPFPAEFREDLEIEYSNRDRPEQNRIRFFLELTRAEYERIDFAASIAPDPANKAALKEQAAVVRALHNEAVRYLEDLADRRRSAAISARRNITFGSTLAPEPDSDDPSVQASRYERPY